MNLSRLTKSRCFAYLAICLCSLFLFIQNAKRNSVEAFLKEEERLKERTVRKTVDTSNQKIAEEFNIINEKDYVPQLEKLKRSRIVSTHNVTRPVDKAINIGMIIVNINKDSEISAVFIDEVERQLTSMLDYTSPFVPLHFVIVTDPKSLNEVSKIFFNFLTKRLTFNVVQTRWFEWRKFFQMPRIDFSFVNYEEIVDANKELVFAMRNMTLEAYRDLNKFWKIDKDPEDTKYTHPLFFIGPNYGRAFTKLDKIIFLDSQDLEFRSDITELFLQFEYLERWPEHVIGIGPDITVHYRLFLNDYINSHIDTKFGLPGRFQGFNSGVVLYHLDRIRKNKNYNRYMEPEKAVELLKKFMLSPVTGDQDFLTVLGFVEPELFYLLDCKFNAQTNLQYMNEEVFDLYHYCDKLSRHKIIHHNGCDPAMHKNCGYSKESKKYIAGEYGFITRYSPLQYYIERKSPFYDNK